MKAKEHPDWRRIFSGSRVRPEFERRIIDIASEVARPKSSYYGNMLHSSETRIFEFLDGHVGWKMAQFRSPGGVWITGEKCLQYVLYELGFDPRALLSEAAVFYKHQELKAELKAVATAGNMRST
jgi:hypothetical protein